MICLLSLRNFTLIKQIFKILFMKHTLMLLVAALLCFQLHAQDSKEAKEGPQITFENETIDYGTIERNADGNREFKLTNTGTEPLIISNCQGTCGCTVPNCPKEPILPGESAKIGVKYATDRLGQFNKGIKVYSNATPADQPIMIHIKGNVIPDPNAKEEEHDHNHDGHTH